MNGWLNSPNPPGVDQILAELLAADDSLQHRLLAFRIALSRQDWTKAQQTLEAINERFGPSLSLQMALVEYNTARGQLEEADAILREATVTYPDASEPVILLASLYLDQNKSPECAVDFAGSGVAFEAAAASRSAFDGRYLQPQRANTGRRRSVYRDGG